MMTMHEPQTDFGEQLRKITEAYCSLKQIPIQRRYRDEELTEEMAEVAIAIAQAKS